MEPAARLEAVDRLAAAYGRRNRLDAGRAASLSNGTIAVVFAALGVYGGHWPLAAVYGAVAVVLFVSVVVVRRRMRRAEREIALLRVVILSGESGGGGQWTH